MQTKSQDLQEQALVSPPEDSSSFLAKHGQKLAALTFWLVALGSYFWYARQNDLTPLEVINQLIQLLRTSSVGPLLYILVYVARPLFLFSAALLTISAGLLFGPVWGMIYSIVGGNLSALVAYGIGRYFGKGLLDGENEGIVQQYAGRMRDNPFESVLTMRFIFLPYDLVNYLAGFLDIDWKPFLLATFLGSIPGGLSFVLIGASIEGETITGVPSVNPWTLVASLAIFVGSLGLSRYFKKREAQKEEVVS